MPRPSVAAERREAILEAFESCALRKGLDATTLADVAEASGLPRPLVRHFMGNRADLVNGLIERMMRRAAAAIDEALSRAADKRDDEVLEIIVNHAFTDETTNRLMIQLWQQSWTDAKLRSQLQGVYRRCIEQIHAQLFTSATSSTRDSAFAVTALALGHAVLDQFGVQPDREDSLVRASRVITQRTASNDCKEP